MQPETRTVEGDLTTVTESVDKAQTDIITGDFSRVMGRFNDKTDLLVTSVEAIQKLDSEAKAKLQELHEKGCLLIVPSVTNIAILRVGYSANW